MLTITLFGAFMFTINLNLCTSTGDRKDCLSEHLKGTGARGRLQNKLNNSDDPIFYLEFIQQNGVKKDDVRRSKYHVFVSSNVPSKSIKEVKIIAKGYNPCGGGAIGPNDFNHTKTNCGSILQTKKRNFSIKSPFFTWTTPGCGCVEFRAIVISGDIYYSDDENVKNGPLSQRVCIAKGSEESYLNALCYVLDKYKDSDSAPLNEHFVKQIGLELKESVLETLVPVLINRANKIRYCCKSKTRLDCMMDIRRERINELCDHNKPDIQIVNYKVNYTLEKQKLCCYLYEQNRYDCFKGPLVRVTPETFFDYSYDVTHPANDLALFGSIMKRKLYKMITYAHFETKPMNSDKYEDPFKIGTNMIKTDAFNQKTDDTNKQEEEKKLTQMCCGADEKFGSSSPIQLRPTNKAEDECEQRAKTFVGQNLISNISVCLHHFSACCINRSCCAAGKDYSYSITRRVASNACRKGYLAYLKQQKLKTWHRQPCKANFQNCCIDKTFKK